MNKLILTVISTNLFLFGGTYSETLSDGQLGFYAQIDTAVQTNAEQSINQINFIRANVIKNIVNNDELKKELLTNTKVLSSDEVINKSEFDFELNRYLNLQNIEMQIEPIKDKK